MKIKHTKDGATISFNSWEEYYAKVPIIEQRVHEHNLQQDKKNLSHFCTNTLHPSIRRYSLW